VSALLDSINTGAEAARSSSIADNTYATLVFVNQDELWLQELVSFSQFFRSAYNVFHLLTHENYGGENPVDKLAYAVVEASARAHHGGGQDCQIARLRYESPLEIVLAGIAVSLVVAVIISGGEIQITRQGIKAKLPSLGRALNEIFTALESAHKLKRTKYLIEKERRDGQRETKNPTAGKRQTTKKLPRRERHTEDRD